MVTGCKLTMSRLKPQLIRPRHGKNLQTALFAQLLQELLADRLRSPSLPASAFTPQHPERAQPPLGEKPC